MEKVVIEKASITKGLMQELEINLEKMYECVDKTVENSKFFEFLKNYTRLYKILAVKRIKEIVKCKDLIYSFKNDELIVGYFIISDLNGEKRLNLPEILFYLLDLSIFEKAEILISILKFYEEFAVHNGYPDISVECPADDEFYKSVLKSLGYNFIYGLEDEAFCPNTLLAVKKVNFINIESECEVVNEGDNCCRQRNGENE